MLQGMDAELNRAMWERAMDEALSKLTRVGHDGLLYIGVISEVRTCAAALWPE